MVKMHKHSKLIFIATLLCLLAACSDQSYVGGYRHANEASRLLRLSEDGSFTANSGDVGSYKIDGNRITLTDPTFGNAEGLISGNTITIQDVPDSDTARNLAGTWNKIEKGS